MGLIIPYFIRHEGCPHRCLFCNQWAIAQTGQAPPDKQQEDLQQTIELWLSRSGGAAAAQLAFYGGSFTCLDQGLQARLLQLVAPYISRGRIGSIRLSTRPDCISSDMSDFLRSYGVTTVELGVQSLSDVVLRQAQRGHTAEDSRRAARILMAGGFEVGIQLMPGLPGETSASFVRGVREVIELRPAFVRLYPALVIRDTGLQKLHATSRWRPLALGRAISQVRRARELFLGEGIRVIRMGLQPSRELEAQLVAGPYHPAFGELVIGRDWFIKARRLLAAAGPGKQVTMTISPRDYSAFVGPGRDNLARLQRLPYGSRLVLATDRHLERGQYRYVVN